MLFRIVKDINVIQKETYPIKLITFIHRHLEIFCAVNRKVSFLFWTRGSVSYSDYFKQITGITLPK